MYALILLPGFISEKFVLSEIDVEKKHDSCFQPDERRKYFFRYSVHVGESSFDLKQVAIISAETYQIVLKLILASISIEKNWGD